MSDTPVRNSPLYRVIDPAVKGISERAFLGQLILRGNRDDTAFVAAITKHCGMEPPRTPNTLANNGALQIAWLGPSEWLLTTPSGEETALLQRVAEAIAGMDAAVTDVTDGYTVIVLEGDDAAGILSRDCPLDFHPRVFAVGSCAHSLIGKSGALIVREDTQCFAICVRRSFAEYLYALLCHSADLVARG